MDNENEISKRITDELKKYNLEAYTNYIIKDFKDTRYNFKPEELVLNINNLLHSISKMPSKEGVEAIKAVSYTLERLGCHNVKDAYLKIYGNNKKSKFDTLDLDTIKHFRVFECEYIKYNITNDAETDFWYMINCKTKEDKYNFIENILDELPYGNPKKRG